MRFPTHGVAALLSVALAGCAGGPPAWPGTERAAGEATAIAGAGEAIEIRVEPEPINAPGDDPATLSMSEAALLALRHDPAIQSALAQVRVAQAEAHQERLLPNPVLSVVLRWPEGGGGAIVEAGLAADLISLLSMPGKIEAADHRLRSASAEALVVVLDVMAELRGAYLSVQASEATAPLLDARRAMLDRLVQQARDRLAAGEGERGEVTSLEAELVALDISIAEATVATRAARLHLARLIGRPGAPATWVVDVWTGAEPPIAAEGLWIEAALRHRPEIVAAEWELAALGVDVRSARWLPWEGTEVGVDAEYDPPWSLGPSLAVPLPLFDWGQAERERLRSQAIDAGHRLTATRRAIVQDVRQAHAAATMYADLHRQVRDRLVPLLERRLSETDAAHRGGHSGITPVILAEQSLNEARQQLLAISLQTAQARAALDRAVGGPAFAPEAEPRASQEQPKSETQP